MPDDVLPEFKERLAELITLTDEFCDRHLNDEYKELSRKLAVVVCQPGSPVNQGKPEGWACGLVYAAGWVNFLTDPGQSPHMKSRDLAKAFGVSEATMMKRSKIIRDGLDLRRFDPDFTLPSLVDQNPLIWCLNVNGFIMDIRDAPREAQVVAFENGLIPYIPADQPDREGELGAPSRSAHDSCL